MEIAIQIVSKDKTTTEETIQDLEIHLTQTLATHAKKEYDSVEMLPAVGKGYKLTGPET